MGTVTKAIPVSLIRIDQNVVSVDYSLVPITANENSDYTQQQGRLVFQENETQKEIIVSVVADNTDEPDESFSVVLSNPSNADMSESVAIVTIEDDDPAPSISVTLGTQTQATQTEGDGFSTPIAFELSLSHPSAFNIQVNLHTEDISAFQNVDYASVNATIQFAPGELTQEQTLSIYGDTDIEPDEYFRLVLSNAVNATIDSPLVNATILNDDHLAQVDAFKQTLYNNVLVPYCGNCHTRQTFEFLPAFADSDVNLAYAVTRTIVNPTDNKATRDMNRLTLRLVNDFHNCFSADCADDGTTMNTAIDTWVAEHEAIAGTAPTPISGIRFEDFVIINYPFNENSGQLVQDTSSIQPAADLTVSGNTSWVGNGLQFQTGALAASNEVINPFEKLYNFIVPSGEYTVELWLQPENLTQQNTILSYSSVNGEDFILSKDASSYVFSSRTSTTPASFISTGVQAAQQMVQHVVFTYSSTEGRKIFIDGLPYVCETQTTAPDPTCPIVQTVPNTTGALTNWQQDSQLTIGTSWQGIVHMLAIHYKALSPDQVQHNFDVGY